MHFFTDPEFLKYRGFTVVDHAAPPFELLYLPFKNTEEDLPSFKDSVKEGEKTENGVAIYYSNGCPHTDKYIPLEEKP